MPLADRSAVDNTFTKVLGGLVFDWMSEQMNNNSNGTKFYHALVSLILLTTFSTASAKPMCFVEPETFGNFSLTTKIYGSDDQRFMIEVITELRNHLNSDSHPLTMTTNNSETRNALQAGYVLNRNSFFLTRDFEFESNYEQLGVLFTSFLDNPNAIQIKQVSLSSGVFHINTDFIMPNVDNLSEMIAWMASSPTFAFEHWQEGQTIKATFYGTVQGREQVVATAELPPNGLDEFEVVFERQLETLIVAYNNNVCDPFWHDRGGWEW